MVTHLHAQMNAFAFAQYAAATRKPRAKQPSHWTIADRDVCVPEIAN